MATIPKKYKAYVKDFKVAVGPITTTGELVKIDKTDTTGQYVSVCPVCVESPIKPRQTYVCDACESSHPIGELRKAKLVDGELKFVSQEQIAEAKTSDLPKNVLKVTVHPSDEVWTQTYSSGGNAYVFVPSQADEYYSTLVALVADPTKTFLGVCNLRNNEGLFRLNAWRDQLVVQKIAWPDEVDALEAAALTVDEEILKFAKEFVDRITVPFDADSYRSTVKARLAAINATLGDANAPVPVQPAETKPKQSDLLMLLKASVGQ